MCEVGWCGMERKAFFNRLSTSSLWTYSKSTDYVVTAWSFWKHKAVVGCWLSAFGDCAAKISSYGNHSHTAKIHKRCNGSEWKVKVCIFFKTKGCGRLIKPKQKSSWLDFKPNIRPAHRTLESVEHDKTFCLNSHGNDQTWVEPVKGITVMCRHPNTHNATCAPSSLAPPLISDLSCCWQ